MRTVMLSWLAGMQVLYRKLSCYVHLTEKICEQEDKGDERKWGEYKEKKTKGENGAEEGRK